MPTLNGHPLPIPVITVLEGGGMTKISADCQQGEGEQGGGGLKFPKFVSVDYMDPLTYSNGYLKDNALINIEKNTFDPRLEYSGTALSTMELTAPGRMQTKKTIETHNNIRVIRFCS